MNEMWLHLARMYQDTRARNGKADIKRQAFMCLDYDEYANFLEEIESKK